MRRAALGGSGAREAPPLPSHRRRSRRLSRDGNRTGAGAAPFARTDPSRVGARRRRACGSLPRRSPRPAAARRFGGPASPSVYAGVVRRGARRLLPRGRGAAPDDRRARLRCGDRPERRGGGRAHAGPAGAHAEPASPSGPVRRPSHDPTARVRPRSRARSRPRRLARLQARVQAGARRAALGAAQSRGARPRPPRLRRHRRQRQPRPRLGPLRQALVVRRAARPASTTTR